MSKDKTNYNNKMNWAAVAAYIVSLGLIIAFLIVAAKGI